MKAKKTRLYTTLGKFTILMCFVLLSCKKTPLEETRINPPVRSYIITARIDKKGTNTESEGTGVLKGTYDEGSKTLTYKLDFENIRPTLITLRSGIKGSVGELVRELYRNNGQSAVTSTQGSFNLTPLQERNLLKGLWFVAISTTLASPEISGILTLKQK